MVYDPELELKLRLLHECLVAEGAREVLSNAEYNEILEGEYEEKPRRSYVEDLSGIDDCFSESYIKILTDVRIFLLGA